MKLKLLSTLVMSALLSACLGGGGGGGGGGGDHSLTQGTGQGGGGGGGPKTPGKLTGNLEMLSAGDITDAQKKELKSLLTINPDNKGIIKVTGTKQINIHDEDVPDDEGLYSTIQSINAAMAGLDKRLGSVQVKKVGTTEPPSDLRRSTRVKRAVEDALGDSYYIVLRDPETTQFKFQTFGDLYDKNGKIFASFSIGNQYEPGTEQLQGIYQGISTGSLSDGRHTTAKVKALLDFGSTKKELNIEFFDSYIVAEQNGVFELNDGSVLDFKEVLKWDEAGKHFVSTTEGKNTKAHLYGQPFTATLRSNKATYTAPRELGGSFAHKVTVDGKELDYRGGFGASGGPNAPQEYPDLQPTPVAEREPEGGLLPGGGFTVFNGADVHFLNGSFNEDLRKYSTNIFDMASLNDNTPSNNEFGGMRTYIINRTAERNKAACCLDKEFQIPQGMGDPDDDDYLKPEQLIRVENIYLVDPSELNLGGDYPLGGFSFGVAFDKNNTPVSGILYGSSKGYNQQTVLYGDYVGKSVGYWGKDAVVISDMKAFVNLDSRAQFMDLEMTNSHIMARGSTSGQPTEDFNFKEKLELSDGDPSFESVTRDREVKARIFNEGNAIGGIFDFNVEHDGSTKAYRGAFGGTRGASKD